jgi:hypothetical protein
MLIRGPKTKDHNLIRCAERHTLSLQLVDYRATVGTHTTSVSGR